MQCWFTKRHLTSMVSQLRSQRETETGARGGPQQKEEITSGGAPWSRKEAIQPTGKLPIPSNFKSRSEILQGESREGELSSENQGERSVEVLLPTIFNRRLFAAGSSHHQDWELSEVEIRCT